MNRYAQPNTPDRPKQSHQVAEDVANSIPTGDAFDAIDLTLSISERIKQVYQGTYNVLKLVLNNSNLNKVIPNKSNTNNNEIIIQLRNFLRTMDPNSLAAKIIDWISIGYILLTSEKDMVNSFADWRSHYTTIIQGLARYNHTNHTTRIDDSEDLTPTSKNPSETKKRLKPSSKASTTHGDNPKPTHLTLIKHNPSKNRPESAKISKIAAKNESLATTPRTPKASKGTISESTRKRLREMLLKRLKMNKQQ